MGIFKKHFRCTDPIQPIVRTLGMIGKLKLEGLKTLANMENEKELSGKKEFKVGEIFQFGLVKLKCDKGDCGSCNNCYFRYKDDCSVFFDFTGSCHFSNRKDKTDVIFVKVED